MVIFCEETKTFLQIKQQELILSLIVTNCDQRVFNRGLALTQHSIRLHSSKDLAEIKELAQDRKCWRGLTSQIEKAAEVSQTRKWDTTWQYVSKSSHDPQTFVINISQLKLHPKIICLQNNILKQRHILHENQKKTLHKLLWSYDNNSVRKLATINIKAQQK